MTIENGKLRLNVVEAKQHDRQVFVGAIQASTVHALIEDNKMRTDRWSETNPDGYQRAPIPTRYRKFGNFARQPGAVSPTAALLFVRTPEAITMDEVLPGVHEANLDLNSAEIYVPDGQHRLWGLKHACDVDYEAARDFALPFTLMIATPGEDSRFEEAQQFNLINTNQKRVPTDLAQQYLLKVQEKDAGRIGRDADIPLGATIKSLVPHATRLVDMLQKDDDSPWKGLIQLPNSEANAAISQNSFVSSLYPLMRIASDQGWKVGHTADILKAYWQALTELCPEAAEKWDKKANDDWYVLRTTSGVYVMNDLLAWCLGRLEFMQKPTDKQTYVNLFKNTGLDYFKNSWWAAKNDTGAASYGTSAASFKKVRHEIVGDLARAL